jgi:hypothetical protein
LLRRTRPALWTEDEKLRIVGESLSRARLVSSTAQHLALAADDEASADSGGAPMEIVVPGDRRVIADAGVDVAALA